MARPSKKQLADRKKAVRLERRDTRLQVAYLLSPWYALADFAVIVCERCGQEQTADGMQERNCVVCGHDVARTSPRHDSFKAEAALLMVEAAQLAVAA